MEILVVLFFIACMVPMVYIWAKPERDPYERHPSYESEYEND